jgi:hypothetical protein
LRLLNERKLEQLKEKWWHQNPKRQECSSNEEEATGISIENIGGVFILILGGIIISLTMLVVEFFYYKQKEKKDVIPKEVIHMNDSVATQSLPDSEGSTISASSNGLHRVNTHTNGSVH